MTNRESLRSAYNKALHHHLSVRTEASLFAGYEFGRQALEEGVSLLDIVEIHSLYVAEHRSSVPGFDETAALEFLLQTLAASDLATRGFRDTAKDLRRQRDRTAELTELSDAKDDFFANISHEFRTPLSVISGLVEDGMRTDGEYERLAIIGRNCGRLHRLAEDLLDFARIEAGQLNPQFSRVDLAALTDELVQTYASEATRRELTLRVDLPTEPVPWRIDITMWEKILLNLLSNAVKYTDTGSVDVQLRVHKATDDNDFATSHATLTVRDTGIGIPPEELPTIFERFRGARQRPGSAGIGLALVHDLTSILGGTIRVTSEVGIGSEFTVTLPAPLVRDSFAEQPEPGHDAAQVQSYAQGLLGWDSSRSVVNGSLTAPSAARSSTHNDKVTVLVAEDNDDLRKNLVDLLSPHWRTIAAADGDEVWNLAMTERPDLVLSDVMMPRCSGIELLGRLRAHPSTSSTPVLLLSARRGSAAAIEALNAGADDYLVKPFTNSELLARIKSSIELAGIRRREAEFRRGLVTSLQDGVFIFDENATVIEANPAHERLTGFGSVGLPYEWPYPWLSDDKNALDRMRIRMTSEFPDRISTSIVRADGERRWVVISKSPLSAPNEPRKLAVGTVVDVTFQRWATEIDRTIAEFASALAAVNTVAQVVAVGLRTCRRSLSASTVALGIWDSNSHVPKIYASTQEADLTSIRSIVESARHRQALTSEVVGPQAESPHLNGLVVAMGDAVLWVDTGRRRPTTHEQTLSQRLASHLAIALQRGQSYDYARRVSLTLQHSMLGPTTVPRGVAVRYELAVQPLQVGGDWYEVLELPGDRYGFVIGDCVGSGLEAAAVMGQLRSSARALLLRGGGPAEVLRGLDAVARVTPGARFATVFAAIIEPRTGNLTYSNAGHVPPLIGDAGGGPRLLRDALSLPLATLSEVKRPELSLRLDPGAVLLLYTDGLVERRTAPIDSGMDSALSLLYDADNLSPDQIADRYLTSLRPRDGYGDDVALLVYRQANSPMHLVLPARPDALGTTREMLRAWLNSSGLTQPLIDDLVMAANEACSNSIEHGYRDHRPPGPVTIGCSINVEADVDEVLLSVQDRGKWHPPSEARGFRGHGLVLMKALTDSLTIDHSDHGTTVVMTKQLPPEAAMH